MHAFNNRRVVVTGADGFIGSHLVERLLDQGANVNAVCLYTSNGTYGWLEELSEEKNKKLTIHLGDIRDSGFLDSIIEDGDIVFHLAALIAIPYSYIAPASFVDTNIRGTFNVLEACRKRVGVRMINTSTSEVYGTPESIPITEAHRLNAQSPYAATKVAADQLALSYASSFELDVRTIRPFNTFGPRQSMRAVIPTVLAQLLAGCDRLKLGSLDPKRDFTFVDDTVDGFIKIGSAELPPGTVIQLGTGSAVSIAELIELCMQVTGSYVPIENENLRIRPTHSEVQVLLSDSSRALNLLGWSPKVSLIDGLKETADWLRPRLSNIETGRYYK